MITARDLNDLDLSYSRKNDARWIGVFRSGKRDMVMRADRVAFFPGVGNVKELLFLFASIRKKNKRSDFHAGILDYALGFEDRLRDWKPRRLVGHSLGGATAQILGQRLGVPVTTIGAVGSYRGVGALPREGMITNIYRSDDYALIYPPGQYRALGRSVIFKAKDTTPGTHNLASYIRVHSQILAAGKASKKKKKRKAG